MSLPSSPPPVKLFVVTIHRDPQAVDTAITSLAKTWGKLDFVSEDFPFIETDYYQAEMGNGLIRRFYSFESLIPPDRIADVKLHCINIEKELSANDKRRINLDPGYLDTSKLVLASAKYGGQKIYLRNGIYADMTLIMYKHRWVSFSWGFPDFKSGKYDAVLTKIRDLYKKNPKSHGQA